MREKSIDTLCRLEKIFPPGMFDIQVHLISHLVDEVEVAGVVHARWMYWVERFMKVFIMYSSIIFCLIKNHDHICML
jgi:hypothetical protein